MGEPPQLAEDVVPPISPPPKMADTRYYQDLMNSVPMESVSVSLMMHCMLEQVSRKISYTKDLILRYRIKLLPCDVNW